MGDDSGTVLKLIPEYSGDGNVAEWLDKVDLVCELRKVDDVAAVLPLRLTGSAFAVYQQLPKEKKIKVCEIKKSLLAAFAVNSFAAYEQFTTRKLVTGESPDVFVANLRTLADQFGGVSERTLMCAFVTGLPDGVRHMLRAGANVEDMKMDTVLKRARALLSDEGNGTACGLMMASGEGRKEERQEEVCASVATSGARTGSQRGCFKCGGPNHFARHCWTTTRERRGIRCFKCEAIGHIAAKCPGDKPVTPTGNE